MNRSLLRLLVALLLSTCLFAQEDENKFRLAQADRLNKFAKTAFKDGYPRQAKLIWLQVVKLYDADSAEARKGLMHVKVGTSWAPDPKATYPTDDTGSGAAGTSLFKAYEKLKQDLAAGHKRQAQAWAKAGRTDRSRHHFEMVLRWVKDDKEAQVALEHKDIGGVTGTDLEETLYVRSKMIEKAVADQSKVDYPVEKVEVTEPALDRAQVKYVSVKTEHFLLHGDPEEEAQLIEALKWGERALRVVREAFPWPNEVRAKMAYFVSKDTYKQILRANADQVPNLEWRLEHTGSSAVGDLVVGGIGSAQVMFDGVVRTVAQRYAGFRTDGLREGVGHTFVGMVFNNNRIFSVDREKQEGTVATEEDRAYQSPNFDVWKSLALELAWKMTGGVTALDLPFIDAANFSNEQRIKAWSFCDYMMRRDPELLRKLDGLGVTAQQHKSKRPPELAETFAKETGVTVAQLDKEWEDFWTEATPVLQAIRNNTPPLKAISKDVEKWLAALNEARALHRATPVTWSSQFSTRCFEHATYLKANKNERGPESEHRQSVDLGGSHLASVFAQMAVVEVDAKLSNAKKMFARWMFIPGYRDILVHDYLLSVGIYSEGDILVIDATAGLGVPRSKKSGYTCHPWKDSTGIPVEVQVSEIGPELVQLLEKHGQAGKKAVGYPLTLHFGINVPGDRHSYRCAVTDARGNKVEGALLLDSGDIRRSTAPGMVTFYPFESLPRGQVNVNWSWEIDGKPFTLNASFQTK